MKNDFIKELGYLAYSTRLKRLSDNLMQSGRRMYQKLDIDIEPNWYLIFKLLEKNNKMGVMEIAEALQLAHPSIITICNKMENAGYLISGKSNNDSRKRVLSLSKKAKNKMPEYNSIWQAGIDAMEHTLKSINALEHMELLEQRFAEKDFQERTLEALEKDINQIEIIDYEPQYREDFTQINFQWLESYFYIEDYDREVLTKPQRYILDPGGHILFARLNNKIVGTVALIVREEGAFELSKMGVLEGYRGYKIGQILMDAALAFCKQAGKTRVWLDSNRKLSPAISLYNKVGFKEIPVDPNTPYERCNIRMEMFL